MPLLQIKNLHETLKEFYQPKNSFLSDRVISMISREVSEILYDNLCDQLIDEKQITKGHVRNLIWEYVVIPLNASDAEILETVSQEDADNGSYLSLLDDIVKNFVKDHRRISSVSGGLIKIVDDLDSEEITEKWV